MLKQGSLGLPVIPIKPTDDGVMFHHSDDIANWLGDRQCDKLECFGYCYKTQELQKVDILIAILHELQQLDDARVISGLTATAQVLSLLRSKGCVNTILICFKNQKLVVEVERSIPEEPAVSENSDRLAETLTEISPCLRIAYELENALKNEIDSVENKDDALDIAQETTSQGGKLLDIVGVFPPEQAVCDDSEEGKLLGQEAKRLKRLLRIIRQDHIQDEDATICNVTSSEQNDNPGANTGPSCRPGLEVYKKGQIVRVKIVKIRPNKAIAQIAGSYQRGVIYKEEIPSTWFKGGVLNIPTKTEFRAEVLSINPDRVKLSLTRPLKPSVQAEFIV